jgi:hypothetical protein
MSNHSAGSSAAYRVEWLGRADGRAIGRSAGLVAE